MDSAQDVSRSYVCRQNSGESQFESCRVADGMSLVSGYRRRLEFDPRDLPGQDFCGWRFDGQFVVGVACDGVSQSFMGQLAAEGVGSALLEALWGARGGRPGVDDIQSFLLQVQSKIQDAVLGYPVSPGLASMLAEELEHKRRKVGSQTVFSAFLANVNTGTVTVILCGDAFALVHSTTGEVYAPETDVAARWSSQQGLKGTLRIHEFTGTRGVVIGSDGMSPEWGRNLDDVRRVDKFLEQVGTNADRDDLCFVALTRAATAGLKGSPTPNALEHVSPNPPSSPRSGDHSSRRASENENRVPRASSFETSPPPKSLPSAGKLDMKLLSGRQVWWLRIRWFSLGAIMSAVVILSVVALVLEPSPSQQSEREASTAKRVLPQRSPSLVGRRKLEVSHQDAGLGGSEAGSVTQSPAGPVGPSQTEVSPPVRRRDGTRSPTDRSQDAE